MKKKDIDAISQFDSLPDAAFVRVTVAAAVLGVSTPTVWRWAKHGVLQAPRRLGGATLWNVGHIRQLAKP